MADDLVAGGPRTVAVSVDMDAPENYAEFYRRPPEEALSLGAFYEQALPRLLDLFEEQDVRATFFCIGEHAVRPEGREAIGEIVRHDHEIANHSYGHRIGFRRLPPAQKMSEIRRAHEVLASEAGREPVGFRAPGYDLDRDTVRALVADGYAYDSSVLPSPWLLPMKLLVRWKAKRLRWSQPAGLGGWTQGLGSKRPRRVMGSFVELPLSVLPGSRVPFYGSFTQQLGLGWFRRGLKRLRRGSLPIHYAIHLQELAEVPRGVPAYGKSPQERIEIISQSLALLAEGSECIPLRELAERVAAS